MMIPRRKSERFTYDIAYLTANPLINSLNGTPIEMQLGVEAEKSTLIDVCATGVKMHHRSVNFIHTTATHGNLTSIMTSKCRVLHYSGHGLDGQLAFENEPETGSSHIG